MQATQDLDQDKPFAFDRAPSGRLPRMETAQLIRILETEGQLLARVPVLLQKRFDAQYSAHQERLAASGQADSPAAWMHPAGWLARFCKDLQTLLLAEAELRMQPSAGLLEALNKQQKHI